MTDIFIVIVVLVGKYVIVHIYVLMVIVAILYICLIYHYYKMTDILHSTDIIENDRQYHICLLKDKGTELTIMVKNILPLYWKSYRLSSNTRIV